jgi:1,2-diacylglycerol 3-beta-galactosyltransferase
VLLVGGGDGMGRLEQAAVSVAARLSSFGRQSGVPLGQLAVVCGRNQRLRERLARREWPVPATVAGYVDTLWDWMAASEFIITKAGPNTIMEACASGLPVLLNGYIPGQEEQNVAYVLRHGVGAYAADADQAAQITISWLGPERQRLAAMARRARAISRPDAALHIVDDIVEYGVVAEGRR